MPETRDTADANGATSVARSDDEPIVALIRELAIEIGRYSDVYAAAHAMNVTDLEALAYVCAADSASLAVTAGELSSGLSLSPPATSAMLTRLERAGHVRREPDPSDGRKVLVRPLQAAADAVADYYEPLGRSICGVVNGFGAAERATIVEALRRIVNATRTTRLGAAESQALDRAEAVV
jgi:DNA-binding MarR family transcriptional regulator